MNNFIFNIYMYIHNENDNLSKNNIKIVENNNLDINNQSNNIILLDFYADWCCPCKIMSKKIDEYAIKYNNITFYKIDIDNNDEIASNFKVNLLPTIIIFDGNNQKYSTKIEGCDFDKIESSLEKLIE